MKTKTNAIKFEKTDFGQIEENFLEKYLEAMRKHYPHLAAEGILSLFVQGPRVTSEDWAAFLAKNPKTANFVKHDRWTRDMLGWYAWDCEDAIKGIPNTD